MKLRLLTPGKLVISSSAFTQITASLISDTVSQNRRRIKKGILSFVFCTLFTASFAQQYSVSSAASSLTSSLTDFSLDLSGDWDSTRSFVIERTLIFDSDTILVYQGTYDLQEQDAKSFISFSRNETTGHILLSLGAFELFSAGTYKTSIRFLRTDEEEVEIILND